MEDKRSEEQSTVNEASVIKQQYILLGVALLLFFPGMYVSTQYFHTLKYGILLVVLPVFGLFLSMIKNRVSIFRGKFQTGYLRGEQAFRMGIFLLVVEIIWVAYFFVPGNVFETFLNH